MAAYIVICVDDSTGRSSPRMKTQNCVLRGEQPRMDSTGRHGSRSGRQVYPVSGYTMSGCQSMQEQEGARGQNPKLDSQSRSRQERGGVQKRDALPVDAGGDARACAAGSPHVGCDAVGPPFRFLYGGSRVKCQKF